MRHLVEAFALREVVALCAWRTKRRVRFPADRLRYQHDAYSGLIKVVCAKTRCEPFVGYDVRRWYLGEVVDKRAVLLQVPRISCERGQSLPP
jgi:hypothetical protein